MSPLYLLQVKNLQVWFEQRLRGKKFVLTGAEYCNGIDVLCEPFKRMVKAAFDEWLTYRRYELSYNQMCLGFFRAAEAVGSLIIEPE